MYLFRWNQASSVRNSSYGSRRSSDTARNSQLQKCALLFKSPSSIAWTFLILYGRRHKFLVDIHGFVVETCAYWANRVKDLQGDCSDLAQVSSRFSSVNTAFSLAYWLPKKYPVECTFFTNWKIVDEDETFQSGKFFFYAVYVIFFWHFTSYRNPR
jgi:hypothetical protein